MGTSRKSCGCFKGQVLLFSKKFSDLSPHAWTGVTGSEDQSQSVSTEGQCVPPQGLMKEYCSGISSYGEWVGQKSFVLIPLSQVKAPWEMDCGSLNENVLHKLMCLYTWLPIGGAVWGRWHSLSRGSMPPRMYFGIPQTSPLSNSLFLLYVCGWRCDLQLPASMLCWLLPCLPHHSRLLSLWNHKP